MNQDVRLWWFVDRDGNVVSVADADLDTWWIDGMIDGGDAGAPPAPNAFIPTRQMMGIGQ